MQLSLKASWVSLRNRRDWDGVGFKHCRLRAAVVLFTGPIAVHYPERGAASLLW